MEGLLIKFLDEYERARGWRARRLYLTTRELYDLMMGLETHRNFNLARGPVGQFAGADMRMAAPQVALAIKQWDLKPWPMTTTT